ncbi:MAG: glycosyltransferase family 9 protein [Deltaproteobacteria bacterium]|nr:glycosyltransferase family 9 protein [Deltaproteobacteria bacterium]
MDNMQKILIYHIGSLGDTLVAIPALRVVRMNYPQAYITMMTDDQPGRRLVQANDILNGSGLIDDYILYSAGSQLSLVRLLLRLRHEKFDGLIYLIRITHGGRRLFRDKLYFKLAGIKRFFCLQGGANPYEISSGSVLPRMPHVTDIFLSRLAASGMEVSLDGDGKRHLRIGAHECDEVERWLAELPSSRGRKWIGVGIGGKMAVKIWPLERYERLVDRLIETCDVWPVVFGGPESLADGHKLVGHWKRGYVACGALGIRAAIEALSRCSLFVGNDTGTIHMAAAAGVRCVGVYSSRDYPGLWEPYGSGHIVFRTPLPCEGCMLEECAAQHMKCILSISVEPVFQACRTIIEEEAGRKV